MSVTECEGWEAEMRIKNLGITVFLSEYELINIINKKWEEKDYRKVEILFMWLHGMVFNPRRGTHIRMSEQENLQLTKSG